MLVHTPTRRSPETAPAEVDQDLVHGHGCRGGRGHRSAAASHPGQLLINVYPCAHRVADARSLPGPVMK
ncbi:hypothetical protein UO65_0148 [Actinokineospora spheciospongiae]|uniref:Uncharacterized protein n=1 Tax=Actinokineospora spheciospongiae TaxID=909613 RepID=W7J695_9PSEU|nr:hypothetical protein UO65_0148 [Actinokineospora spheciospongiae]